MSDNPYGVEVAPLTPTSFDEDNVESLEELDDVEPVKSDLEEHHHDDVDNDEEVLEEDSGSINIPLSSHLPGGPETSSHNMSDNTTSVDPDAQRLRAMIMQQQNLEATTQSHPNRQIQSPLLAQPSTPPDHVSRAMSAADRLALDASIRDMEEQLRNANSSGGLVQGVDKTQLTLLYAALLAKQRGINVCSCKRHRCKSCLNCVEAHCICGSSSQSQTSDRLQAAAVHIKADIQKQLLLQQQQQQQQLRQSASSGTSTPSAASTKRIPDISDVARYYVRLPPSPCANPQQCQVCQKSSQSATSLKCGACRYTAHVSCLGVDIALIPRDIWFCKNCFPDAEHIYYTRTEPNKLSLVEIGRVLQIVTGGAGRLGQDAQIAFVEQFLKSIPAKGQTRIFIHNKLKTVQRQQQMQQTQQKSQ